MRPRYLFTRRRRLSLPAFAVLVLLALAGFAAGVRLLHLLACSA